MTKFVESSVGGIAKSARNIFKTRLISEGQGSSGFYSAEVLKRDIPKALPKGTKVYFDHMSADEMETGRARSMSQLVGVFESVPYFDEQEQASFADIRIYENSPTYKNVPEFIAEALNDVGVSIEVHAGKKDDSGFVEELSFSPHNSLAIVTAGGARGKIDSLIESFRTTENENTDEVRNNMEKAEMLEALKESNESLVATFVEAVTKVLKPAEEKADKPSLEVISEAIATAELTPEGRKAVYAAVEAGVAVESAVQVEKDREAKIFEALKTKAESEGGFLVQESAKTDFNAQYEAGIK